MKRLIENIRISNEVELEYLEAALKFLERQEAYEDCILLKEKIKNHKEGKVDGLIMSIKFKPQTDSIISVLIKE